MKTQLRYFILIKHPHTTKPCKKSIINYVIVDYKHFLYLNRKSVELAVVVHTICTMHAYKKEIVC